MNLWPVEHFFEHIYHHFWVGLLLPPVGLLLHPPKSDDKYAQKSVQLVRGSSFRSDFLQNPYFNTTTTMFTINHYSTNTWTFLIYSSILYSLFAEYHT